MKLLCNILCFQFLSIAFSYGNTPLYADAITLNITTVNTTCQKSNGKIIIQPSGGVAPYDFRISGPFAPQPSGIFWGLPAGLHTVTVTDAVGTVATQNVTLTNTFNLPVVSVVAKQKPSGCNTFDATLTLAGSNGAAPYTFSLDDITYQTSNTFTNLTAGGYAIAVKDANGCTSFSYFTASSVRIDYNFNCSMYIDLVGRGIQCLPVYALGIDVRASVRGGTPPYMYSIDGINYQANGYYNNLVPGFNRLWIKDAAGLEFIYSFSTMDDCIRAFNFTNAVQPALCGQNGTITVTATDGTAPYSYSLDGVNFQSSNQFTGLANGTYTVTVKDGLNFTVAKLAAVPNNCVTITATTTNSTCGSSNGAIQAQASGGTAPYQFSIDGINYATTAVFSNRPPGNNRVYAKDASNNIATRDVFVPNTAGPQITAADTTSTGCDNKSGKITVAAANGTAPLMYSINGTAYQTAPQFTGLPQGTYTVWVKDAIGCTTTKQAVITMNIMAPTVNFGKDSTLCEGNTLLLTAANTNATYLWQDNSTAPTFLVQKQGKYYVTVSRQNCFAADTINVAYNLKPAFTLGADQAICTGSTITLNPQLTNVNYLWQDGAVTPQYIVTQPGLYHVTATNTCGVKTDSVIITKGVCKLYIPNAFTPNGDGKNDLFKASFGENITAYSLQIFNRYGELVFESKDKNNGWNGLYKGRLQPGGSYMWLIRYKGNIDNTQYQLKGNIILIR